MQSWCIIDPNLRIEVSKVTLYCLVGCRFMSATMSQQVGVMSTTPNSRSADAMGKISEDTVVKFPCYF